MRPSVVHRAIRLGSALALAAALLVPASALPARAAWALADVSEADQLWRAELGWWDRVERDANALLPARDEVAVVLAAVVLLAVNAQRTVRALQTAAQGGEPRFAEASR